MPQPRKQPPRPGNYWKVAVIAAIAVVAVIGINTHLSGIFSPTARNSRFVCSSAGVDHKIFADTADLVGNFSTNTSSALNGSFHASAQVSFYAMNQTEFSNLIHHGNRSAYLYADQDNISGTVNLTFSPGQVDLVILNMNNKEITINFDFTVLKSA